MRSWGWTRSETGENVAVLRCPQCGLSGVDWRAPAEERQRFFETYSYGSEAAWEVPQATLYSLERWVQWMKPYRQRNRWLDVGCGAGALVKAAAQGGWHVEGTELSTVAANRLQEEGFCIHVGSLPEIALPHAGYDVITMTELLEHLMNPLDYVHEAYRLLRQGGVLFLTTPNFNGMRRRWFGPAEALCPPDHLWGFTPTAFGIMLDQVGFKRARVWTDGLNPYLILAHLRPRAGDGLPPKLWEDTNALRLVAHKKVLWRLIKAFVNGMVQLTNLGDSLKAFAIKL